jgi:hypothetical protein
VQKTESENPKEHPHPGRGVLAESAATRPEEEKEEKHKKGYPHKSSLDEDLEVEVVGAPCEIGEGPDRKVQGLPSSPAPAVHRTQGENFETVTVEDEPLPDVAGAEAHIKEPCGPTTHKPEMDGKGKEGSHGGKEDADEGEELLLWPLLEPSL